MDRKGKIVRFPGERKRLQGDGTDDLDRACDECLDQVTFLRAALIKAELQLEHLSRLRGHPLAWAIGATLVGTFLLLSGAPVRGILTGGGRGFAPQVHAVRRRPSPMPSAPGLPAVVSSPTAAVVEDCDEDYDGTVCATLATPQPTYQPVPAPTAAPSVAPSPVLPVPIPTLQPTLQPVPLPSLLPSVLPSPLLPLHGNPNHKNG